MVFYIIKYDSLLKGSATGTSIKFINLTVKQNLIWCPKIHLVKLKLNEQNNYAYGCRLFFTFYFTKLITFCSWLSAFCLHIYMSHFSYGCKMRYPLNLVLESWEYLWSYLTFWVVILDYGLKLHKLLIRTLVMLQKWLEIHQVIVWSLHCVLFPAIFATEKFQKKCSTLSLKLNYWSPRHQTAVFKVLISFKCS